jgi:hypothetical protein
MPQVSDLPNSLPVLQDQTKERIRAEEIFRSEVKRGLDAQSEASKTVTMKFWKALNTPFVLWTLSTILVGIGGWVFSTIQAERDSHRSNSESRKKIVTEIEYRLDQSILELDAIAEKVKTGKRGFNEAAIFNALIERLDSRGEQPVFPDFAQRSFPSLLIEFQSRLPKPDDRLKEGISIYRTIKSKALGNASESFNATYNQTEIDNMLKTIQEARVSLGHLMQLESSIREMVH